MGKSNPNSRHLPNEMVKNKKMFPNVCLILAAELLLPLKQIYFAFLSSPFCRVLGIESKGALVPSALSSPRPLPGLLALGSQRGHRNKQFLLCLTEVLSKRKGDLACFLWPMLWPGTAEARLHPPRLREEGFTVHASKLPLPPNVLSLLKQKTHKKNYNKKT